MVYDTVLKIIKERRTVRKYIPDKQVPIETLEAILEASRWSPSGANTQPWEFIVVREPEKVKKVAKVFMDQAARIVATGFPHPPQNFHKKVSTYILVCTDERFKSIYPRVEDADIILQMSIGACIQTILLAATSLGIASAWQTPTLEPQAHQEMKDIFNIPEFISVHSVLILGYTKGDRMAADFRRPLESMIHLDGFDESKLRDEELTKQENYFPELMKNIAEQQKKRKNLQKEN